MGICTELYLNAVLKEDTPREVKDILTSMFENGLDDFEPRPIHPFFYDSRASFLGNPGDDKNDIAGFNFPVLKVRTEVKNHDDVLEKFLHWIAPYVQEVEDSTWELEGQEVEMVVSFEAPNFVLTCPEKSVYGDAIEDRVRSRLNRVVGLPKED